MNPYQGGCHCTKIRYTLDWPDAGALPARRCTCSYCTRFNGTWTSHPEASLELKYRTPDGAFYRFGTKTADFIFCRSCGVTVAVVCTLEDRVFAVVNINTLDADQGIEFETGDSDFDGETVENRLDRRKTRWIGNVSLVQR